MRLKSSGANVLKNSECCRRNRYHVLAGKRDRAVRCRVRLRGRCELSHIFGSTIQIRHACLQILCDLLHIVNLVIGRNHFDSH